ncbi:uncharacterized protein F5147DRAFT_803395 [Suillus discolor]|uniref:Uncharacterized protein n=1 Tax=Suillus discolor TaxID=1912936 RepID=A0A9P7ERN3_9AGAM|nr:uncharacterized protein F5147DRAFT_803395 [Suillus discolor]KAG2082663.1 hypothetical protein F5147DRAFT_803395 [Suillus discolor]
MNRLHSDPSLLVCPDFSGDPYQASRASLVSPTTTDAQAADLLRAVWITTNNSLCAQWRQQVTEDERLRAEEQRLAEEESERQRLALRLEEEATTADERKKNRIKHIPIPVRRRPDSTDDEVLVSDFALRKIDKGHFVELYYWTNVGLQDAHSNYRTRDDEGMIPTAADDGSTVWVNAAVAKPSSRVIADRDLSPVEFAQAVLRMIAALEDYDWPVQRVQMLARFWGALMLHRYWNSMDRIAQRAIMIYQEEQRRAWHNAIPLPKGAWDISILDEDALLRTFDRVFRDMRHRDLDEQRQPWRRPLPPSFSSFETLSLTV